MHKKNLKNPFTQLNLNPSKRILNHKNHFYTHKSAILPHHRRQDGCIPAPVVPRKSRAGRKHVSSVLLRARGHLRGRGLLAPSAAHAGAADPLTRYPRAKVLRPGLFSPAPRGWRLFLCFDLAGRGLAASTAHGVSRCSKYRQADLWDYAFASEKRRGGERRLWKVGLARRGSIEERVFNGFKFH